MACSSLPAGQGTKSIHLDKLLGSQDVKVIPFTYYGEGLFLIPVGSPQGEVGFIIDTGATRSAIFKDRWEGYLPDKPTDKFANVFGLVNKGTHPIVEISQLRIGDIQLPNWLVAVLPGQEGKYGVVEQPAGIIGMDLLKDYSLFADAEQSLLYFIPSKYAPPAMPRDWRRVSLKPNPYSEADVGLHFFDLRVGNHLMPALLDTGAEFNVLNWNATVIPQIKQLKRRLRQEWELQGANDVFDPTSRVNVSDMRAERMIWDKSLFVIMSFDHLDLLGVKDKPLAIAGAGIFGRKSFYMNFRTDEMWFAPQQDTKNESSQP